MSGKFRRYFIPNSIVFVTQVVKYREPIFRHPEHVDLLREVLRNVKVLHPFQMLGYVFLYDHLHLLFRPTTESNFDKIMGSFKTNFTKAYKKQLGISGSMNFWQARFRDHIIRSDIDLHKHLDYIHYNPVHHGLVKRPDDWKDSSFGSWKEKGYYADHWGWSLPETLADWTLPSGTE